MASKYQHADDREEETLELFNEYACRFQKCHMPKSESERLNLNAVLDQLNAIRIEADSVQATTCSKVIEHCCLIIAPKSCQMTIKACLLLTTLLTKTQQQVSLTNDLLARLVDFIIECLKQCESWALPDVLRTAGSIFYGTGGRITNKALEELLPEGRLLHNLIFSSSTDSHIRRMALQCVENISLRCTPYIDDYYASICLSIFLNVVKTRMSRADEIDQCRLLISALRGIQNILLNTKFAHVAMLGEILAALKAYNFYGRDDPNLDIPSCLYPTNMGPDVPKSLLHPNPLTNPAQRKATKKKSKSRKTKPEAVDSDEDVRVEAKDTFEDSLFFTPLHVHTSSESEFSDTEGGTIGKINSFQSKVRQCSLSALHAVVKGTDKRLIFGYWTSFIPTSSEDIQGTLLAVSRDDSSCKVRVAALTALSAFIEGSKTSLLLATESEASNPSPFTPFSVMIGNMIKEVHSCILSQLSVETSYMATTQLIKCMACVIGNSPYQKLKPGLLSRAVKLIRPYLSHRDPNIRVAALTCMGSVVSIHAPLMEVNHILSSLKQESTSDEKLSQNGTGTSSSLASQSSYPSTPPSEQTSKIQTDKDDLWLVRTCARNTRSSVAGVVIPLPIRLESLQVLSLLVAGYLPLVCPCLDTYTDILTQALEDSDASIQLLGAKAVESTAMSMMKHVINFEHSNAMVDMACSFWTRLFAGPLVNALQYSSNNALKATCCDCMANIGGHIFQKLPRKYKILCITLLLGLSSDPDGLVRGSASRSLGIYVLFSSLREDVSFVADVVNAVMSCAQDSNVAVRVKASWALANTTDALVLNLKSDDIDSFAREFSDVLLIKMFSVASSAADDSDKVKYNGVRALGNLLRYLQPHTLERRNMTPIIESAVEKLVHHLSQGIMKVRWNACYALGNLLQNDYILSGSSSWLEQIYSGLCLAMKDCKNFKVRINAATALSTPSSREKYGSSSQFSFIWKYLVTAMLEANTTNDFSEYKYIETFTSQLCMTFLHLVKLITAEDLPTIGAILFSKEDVVTKCLSSVSKTVDFSAAETWLDDLQFTNLTSEQSTVLLTLKTIIRSATAETEDLPKATFKPVYD